MHVLCRETLADHRLNADFTRSRQGACLRVLQFGEGAFLRGFADWMIDVANGAGVLNARVSVVEMRQRGIGEILRHQDGLYTVLLRGLREGIPFSSRRIVSCIEQVLKSGPDWFDLLALAADPSLRVVLSDTSESGIADVDEPWRKRQSPQSFPAQVTALLFARYQALGGGRETGLLFLPCEAIEANGANLCRIVLKHAQDWGLPEAFIAWVTECNHFCNTLVDCIVPNLPATEAEVLKVDSGYTDPLLTVAEPFHQWVIEGPPALAEIFPLHKAGLDVVWTLDLQPYRARKLRLFNGLHSVGASVALGTGVRMTSGMLGDATLSAFLQRVAFDEVLPSIPLPEEMCRRYVCALMERMANPYVHHELAAIMLNSISKWQLRVLPALKSHVATQGRIPAGLCFSLAALLDYSCGGFNAQGIFIGRGHGGNYPVRDTPEVLAILAEAWRSREDAFDSLAQRVQGLLADPRLWGEDLNLIPGLTKQVTTSLAHIRTVGMRAALAALLETREHKPELMAHVLPMEA